MKTFRILALTCAALLLAVGSPRPAFAGVKDLPGIESAADMKEWLKLTDDQVAKLDPVVDARITKMDAALEKVATAAEPDPLAFIEEYGAIKKEFDAGVRQYLTPDQLAQWESFKTELEKDAAQAGAKKELGKLQPALKLTDEQVMKLHPAMTTAVQKKIDLLQKLADSGRISMRDKLKAKRAMDDLNGELEKAMAAVMSPDQVAGYKTLKEQEKAARKK